MQTAGTFLKSQLSDWKDHLIEKVLLLSITGTITIVICFLSFFDIFFYFYSFRHFYTYIM